MNLDHNKFYVPIIYKYWKKYYSKDPIDIIFFIFIGCILAIARLAHVFYGGGSFHSDAEVIWYPIAQNVWQGQELYLPGAADNKPPIFLLINQLVYLTGSYFVVFTILINVINGTSAFLLREVFKKYEMPALGTLAAILFIGTVPIVNSTRINVRTFGILFILISLVVDRAIIRGTALAVSGLIIQYAVLAIPVFILKGITDEKNSNPISYITLLVVSGICMVTTSFLLVFAIWGTDSFIAGIHWSFGIDLSQNLPVGTIEKTATVPPESYIGTAQILTSPATWGGYILFGSTRIIYILLPALYSISQLSLNQNHTLDLKIILSLLSLLLSLPLLIRPFYTYWLLPLPFLTGLSGLAIGDYLQDSVHDG